MSGAAVIALVAAALAGQGVAPAVPSPASSGGPVIETQIAAALVADVLPRRGVSELRPSVTVTLTSALSPAIAMRVEAVADGLIADRDGAARDARADVRDAWFEVRGRRGDLRAGYGRLVWGRLDEIAPTDVINPLDAARFLLEGRSEARLAVPFVRGRIVPSDALTIEGVVVPAFRRGRFDRLDEASSPFNLVADALPMNGIVATVPDRVHREPEFALGNLAGGGRVQITLGRADITGSVYRGFDGLGPVSAEVGPYGPTGAVALRVVEDHPRFTMIGADLETTTGEWAWRGEVASFVERSFAARSRPGLVSGRAFDAGVGVDRRAGALRVFGSVVAHREWSDADPSIDRTDVNVVGSIERSFGRERYLGRAFIVGNPGDAAAFLRGLLVWRVRDQLAVEFSGGAFLGSSDDAIGRFRGRDFVMSKIKVWF